MKHRDDYLISTIGMAMIVILTMVFVAVAVVSEMTAQISELKAEVSIVRDARASEHYVLCKWSRSFILKRPVHECSSIKEEQMHYKNGREAKNGDKVVLLPAYGNPVVGILYDAQPGNDACNGRLAAFHHSDPMPNLKECLHLDDVKAALPAEVPNTLAPPTPAEPEPPQDPEVPHDTQTR